MTVKEVDNFEEIARDMQRLMSQFRRKVSIRIERFLETVIMAESKREVPVRTGQLRRSAAVNAPQEIEDGMEIAIGYGTNYGVYVHENLNAHHRWPKKAKFLEDPFNRHADEITTLIDDTFMEIVMGVGVEAPERMMMSDVDRANTQMLGGGD